MDYKIVLQSSTSTLLRFRLSFGRIQIQVEEGISRLFPAHFDSQIVNTQTIHYINHWGDILYQILGTQSNMENRDISSQVPFDLYSLKQVSLVDLVEKDVYLTFSMWSSKWFMMAMLHDRGLNFSDYR